MNCVKCDSPYNTVIVFGMCRDCAANEINQLRIENKTLRQQLADYDSGRVTSAASEIEKRHCRELNAIRDRETKLIEAHFQMCREREELDRYIVQCNVSEPEELALARNIVAVADDPSGATQLCGCIQCVCEDVAQCHGCGAKFCDKHAAESKARHENKR